MLTDSLCTPTQFLHSSLESEPDVLAVLMGERRPRYFMMMLSLGLGPAFAMNLNKGSRKLNFQAFDRRVPVQKQWGSMLCILAYSSPAGFSLLIVLSCAFIFCREKTVVSLCWKGMLRTKWSQSCSPWQRLAPSGSVLSEKRHIRYNTEFDVFKLPDAPWVSAFVDYWSATIIHFSFSWSWCEHDICAAEGMPLPSVSHAGHMEDDDPLTLQRVTGTALVLSKWEWKDFLACSPPTPFIDPSALAACSKAGCRMICRRYCFWNCWLSKPWKESQNRGHLSW